MKKAIFIAATGQNVGKTTLCLGIIAALKKRYSNIGFLKPIGQQHVKIANEINVDKDAVLFKDYFNLSSDYQTMSPVIIPPGYTRDYIDGKNEPELITKNILESFQKISEKNDFTIVEGTGHVGVGSIINFNNARIASLLDIDVVLIAPGGLGSSFDELALNITMCHTYGVEVKGIILNRVYENKKAMIENYFPRALQTWGIPLIGCVPYSEFLNSPSFKDFETLFSTNLISGVRQHYSHFEQIKLVAGSLDTYKQEPLQKELIITPASRDEIILETLKRYEELKKMFGVDVGFGMILTSPYPPSDFILGEIKKSDIPCLYAPLYSYDAMKMITSFIAKIRKEDVVKIEQAIALVEKNINLDLFL